MPISHQLLRLLLRNVLDKHVRMGQMVQQLRPQNYADEIQCYDRVPPDDAPDWSFIEQPDMVYDTEYIADDNNLNFDEDELDTILSSNKEDTGKKSGSFMQED
ncbi:hypothetical protein C1646_777166 [Rhizophagus diaphanus]|nr:hypothetical protein C1646_777166 [Rhizophagus diaphanus] [Rhizophagus sp. MUCL 43196]